MKVKVWYNGYVDPVSKYANSRGEFLWDKMVPERGGLPTILSNPRGLHIWLGQPDRPFRVFNMTTDKSKIKYFLYARKSSESEDKQVQSIDDQIDRLTKLASERGLVIKEILRESHSAKTPTERPIFNKMLERIEAGEAGGILCWQVNRLARNPVDGGRLQWLLMQRVIQSIMTIDGERRPDDNAVLFSVETGVSTQFIVDHMKNVRRGLDSKLAKGILPCLAPFGYLNEPYERTIIPDPDRFDLVRKMWDIMLTGAYNPSKILSMATNEWGLRTRKTRRMGSKPLSLSLVYKIFTSKFYCGIIEYGGNEYPGQHVKIATFDEYDRVQVLLGRKGKPRPKRFNHAFTGIVHCGECGASIVAETKTKVIKGTGEVKSYTYYHCLRRRKYIACSQCGSITGEELEKQITDELSKYEIIPEFRNWALEVLNSLNDTEVKERAKVYQSQQTTLTETQKQLDRLTQMRYRDLIDDAEYARERDALKISITRLREKVQSTETRSDQWLEVTERAFDFATNARSAFTNGDVQTKKEIFMAFSQNQTLKDGKLSIQTTEWLQRIQDGYKPLYNDYQVSELDKKPLNKQQKAAYAALRTQWWRCRESNPGAGRIRLGVYARSLLQVPFCPVLLDR